jgi:hypothetical protein
MTSMIHSVPKNKEATWPNHIQLAHHNL